MTLHLNPNPNPTSKNPTIVTTSSSSPTPISIITRNAEPDPDQKLNLRDPFQTLITSESLQPPAQTTTYHIYHTHQNPAHALITQHTLPKSSSARRKYLKRNPDALSSPSHSLVTSTEPTPSQSYFLHLPVLAFHDPPRTLRRGPTKTSPPICIVHNSAFWKRWRVLTGRELMGAIDPRGVVRWESRSDSSNKPIRDDEVKGYKVRRWRLWGESGKQYHRDVNAHRNQGEESEKEKDKWDPARAENVLFVNWTHATPFSKRVRWYAFSYAGVEATWKGSRVIPPRKKWSRRLMPVHHLKLVARAPMRPFSEKRGDGEGEEVVLARYSSSLSDGKHGTLVISDEEVRRVFGIQDRHVVDIGEGDVMSAYDVIVATAMCMILGEWQKRKTVIEILLALIGAAGEAGGG